MMNNNKMFIVLLIFGLLILIGIASSAEAATMASEDTDYEDFSFMDFKKISNKTYMTIAERGIKDWWYYNARRYNSVDSIDFRKDFWMEIQPWEYEVCSRGLSTQLKYDGDAGAGSMFSGIYADTVTVAAYKRISERTDDPSKLYEVSWYFHPAKEVKYYSVKLVSSRSGAEKVISIRTAANPKRGSSNYYTMYIVDDYDTVMLTDETTPATYRFKIVARNDSNR